MNLFCCGVPTYSKHINPFLFDVFFPRPVLIFVNSLFFSRQHNWMMHHSSTVQPTARGDFFKLSKPTSKCFVSLKRALQRDLRICKMSLKVGYAECSIIQRCGDNKPAGVKPPRATCSKTEYINMLHSIFPSEHFRYLFSPLFRIESAPRLMGKREKKDAAPCQVPIFKPVSHDTKQVFSEFTISQRISFKFWKCPKSAQASISVSSTFWY